MELQATKTSVITVTRNSSVELSKAIRKIFLKLTEKFVITDIEYAIDYDTNERENIYSAMILGYLTTGGIIDLSDRDTQFPDGIVLDIQSDEQTPTSAVVGNALRVATVDNNGLMSKADKQVLNQLVLDLTEAKGSITTIEGNITDLQERVTALENKEDKDTIYDDSEIRESLESLRTSLTNLQTTSDDTDLELTTDITNLRSELESLKTKSATDDSTLSASIATLETAISQLEAKESHLSDITDIITRLELLETEDESIQSSIEDLTSALTTLRNSYNSTTTSNQALIESIQEEIATLKAKPDYDDSEIKESIESIEDTLSNLNNYDDTEIKQSISTLQSAVTTLQNKEDKDTVYDDSEVQEAIQSIQDTLDSIEEQKTNNTLYNDEEVKESIQTLSTSLTNLASKETKDVSDLNTLITNLSSTITSIQEALESDIQENAEAIESIQTELTGLKQKDTNLTSTIESIQTSLTTLSGNLTTNANAIDSVKTSVATLEGKVDTNDEEVKGLIDEINESIQALEAKEDKDTIYDDSAIQEAITTIQSAITELQNKEDKDTIYDDSALKGRVSAIESSISLEEDSIIVKADKSVAENLLALETSINALEQKEDKDTVYNDEAIQEAITAINATLSELKNKEDKDTVYDDEEIRGLISTLQGAVTVLENKEDKDTIYDDTDIKDSLNAVELAVTELQAKPDYDDSEIKSNISSIQNALNNLKNYDDSDIKFRLSALEDTIKFPALEEGQTFNYVSRDKTVGSNMKELDSVVKSLSDRLAIKEAEEDKDTVYDDSAIQSTISSIQSAITALENKQDKDTVYNDEEVRGLITTLQSSVTVLQAREDKDTVYDDKDIKDSISAINTALDEIKAKPDYDDSEIKADIQSIEESLSNLNNYDDSALTARISVLETNIAIDQTKTYSVIEKEKSVGNNLEIIDTSIKGISDRLSVVEAKEDKDTVYDDSEIKSDIQSINTTLEGLHNYDDTSVVNRITSLESNISIPELENEATYSVIDNNKSIGENLPIIDSKLKELSDRVDNDTIYDDTAIANRLSNVEEAVLIPEPESGTTYKAIDSTKSVAENIVSLNNFIDSSDRILTGLVPRVASLENDITIPELANGDYDFVDTSKTVGENLAIIDTKISEVNDSLDSKLNSSELMKNGYFNAEKTRANGNQTIIRDEETGGGIFAITKTFKENQTEGIRSFLGVNLGDSSVPVFGQIYAVDLDDNYNGVRVNWNTNRMCYITGNTDSSKTGEERWTPEDREIAVKGDLSNYVPKAKYDLLVNLLISKGLVTQEDIDALDS